MNQEAGNDHSPKPDTASQPKKSVIEAKHLGKQIKGVKKSVRNTGSDEVNTLRNPELSADETADDDTKDTVAPSQEDKSGAMIPAKPKGLTLLGLLEKTLPPQIANTLIYKPARKGSDLCKRLRQTTGEIVRRGRELLTSIENLLKAENYPDTVSSDEDSADSDDLSTDVTESNVENGTGSDTSEMYRYHLEHHECCKKPRAPNESLKFDKAAPHCGCRFCDVHSFTKIAERLEKGRPAIRERLRMKLKQRNELKNKDDQNKPKTEKSVDAKKEKRHRNKQPIAEEPIENILDYINRKDNGTCTKATKAAKKARQKHRKQIEKKKNEEPKANGNENQGVEHKDVSKQDEKKIENDKLEKDEASKLIDKFENCQNNQTTNNGERSIGKGTSNDGGTWKKLTAPVFYPSTKVTHSDAPPRMSNPSMKGATTSIPFVPKTARKNPYVGNAVVNTSNNNQQQNSFAANNHNGVIYKNNIAFSTEPFHGVGKIFDDGYPEDTQTERKAYHIIQNVSARLPEAQRQQNYRQPVAPNLIFPHYAIPPFVPTNLNEKDRDPQTFEPKSHERNQNMHPQNVSHPRCDNNDYIPNLNMHRTDFNERNPYAPFNNTQVPYNNIQGPYNNNRVPFSNRQTLNNNHGSYNNNSILYSSNQMSHNNNPMLYNGNQIPQHISNQMLYSGIQTMQSNNPTPHTINQIPYGNNRAMYSNNQALFSNNQTLYGINQMPYGNNQTPFSNNQVLYNNSQRPYNINQTPYNINQPPYNINQTPYINNLTSYSGNQILFTNNQIRYNNSQIPFSNNAVNYNTRIHPDIMMPPPSVIPPPPMPPFMLNYPYRGHQFPDQIPPYEMIGMPPDAHIWQSGPFGQDPHPNGLFQPPEFPVTLDPPPEYPITPNLPTEYPMTLNPLPEYPMTLNTPPEYPLTLNQPPVNSAELEYASSMNSKAVRFHNEKQEPNDLTYFNNNTIINNNNNGNAANHSLSYEVNIPPNDFAMDALEQEFVMNPTQHDFATDSTQHDFAMNSTEHDFAMNSTEHAFTTDSAQPAFTIDPVQHDFIMDSTQHGFDMDSAQHGLVMESEQHDFPINPIQHGFTVNPTQHGFAMNSPQHTYPVPQLGSQNPRPILQRRPRVPLKIEEEKKPKVETIPYNKLNGKDFFEAVMSITDDIFSYYKYDPLNIYARRTGPSPGSSEATAAVRAKRSNARKAFNSIEGPLADYDAETKKIEEMARNDVLFTVETPMLCEPSDPRVLAAVAEIQFDTTIDFQPMSDEELDFLDTIQLEIEHFKRLMWERECKRRRPRYPYRELRRIVVENEPDAVFNFDPLT